MRRPETCSVGMRTKWSRPLPAHARSGALRISATCSGSTTSLAIP